MEDTASTTSLDMAATQLFGWPEIFKRSVQWVSIKIKKARASTDEVENDPEIKVMRELEKYHAESPQDRPRRFVHILDWFHHEGPSGIHNCLVTELLGPSISAILTSCNEMDDFLAPDTILRASRQVLEGIEFAHQAGFVHGGSFDYRHDLWKAGCVIFTLFYQAWPFFHGGFHPNNFYIRTLVEKLGPLPPAWDSQWDEMIAGDKKLQDEIGLLQYEPEERVSVQEALSFIDWVDYREETEEADADEAGNSGE
ncbi:hypothetical protein V495_06856 [Pseudogymnoascus sp. VKM F-4514 (FW-929)]|nr:hypothetical protein V495_06856 [Pseudogymnoascus sp. VKM F-4514 (FW-929)]KFY51746.1 hypothetical protein V497_08874 [Pseudogymnoascus sp. VKM F-4516 (FW-969)]